MKFINVVFLLTVVFTSICYNTVEAEEPKTEVKDGIHKYVMGVDRGDNIGYRVFLSGMSSHQIALEEAAKIEQERKEAYEASQRSRTDKGTRYEEIGTYTVWGQCVPYAQSQGMQSSNYGWAKNYPVQQEPTMFISTYEGWGAGHIVVFEADLGDHLQVRDAGYKWGKITRRVIPKSLVKGYVI